MTTSKPANESTGVDKAMKQFTKTDAEREHIGAHGDTQASAERTSATQPPPSTAPAEKTPD
jgi:hypothetical protein